MTDAAIDNAAWSGARFTIGAALGQSFGVFRRGFVRLLPLALVILLPTLFSASYFSTPVRYPVGFAGVLPRFVHSLPNQMITDICQLVLRVIIFPAAYQEISGQGFPAWRSLFVGLRRFLPALGVLLIIEVLTLLGLILLVVPAGMVICAAYVALPVCVLEKPSIYRSLTRSLDLTRGHRWRIFGLLMVFILMMTLILMAGRLLLAGGFSLAAATPKMPMLLYNWVASAIATVFGQVLTTVVYHRLRVAKEGIGTESIAGVFD